MADGISVVAKDAPVTTSQDFTKDETHPIAGLLGLDTHTLADTDKTNLKAIYDFVRGDAKEMTELEMLSKVRELENRLGLTTIGERRVDKMYRWVKLQSQIDSLTKARDGELRWAMILIVKFEDRDYTYEVEVPKLLKILKTDLTVQDIENAVREALKWPTM